jgi:hypothetical protein
MKNIISPHNRRTLLAMAVLVSALLAGGATQAWARDGYGYANQNDYRDQGGTYHHYGYHNNHRGYWNEQNGARIWISVG